MISRNAFQTFAGLVFAGSALVSSSDAATLVVDSVVRVPSTVSTPVNLTTQGSADWAYWSAGSASTTVAPTNAKISGTAIGDLALVGGGTAFQGGAQPTVERYSFTDGTGPASGTNVGVGGLVFNSIIGTNADGKGFILQITGDPLIERTVTLYLGGYGATGNLILDLPNANQYTNGSEIFGATSPKEISIFTFRFKPDLLTDKLSIIFSASNITDSVNGHVGIEAVTLAAIPEPGVLALSACGLLFIVRRRRSAR